MSLLQDLKFTVRMLRTNPALALSAILATGLGIGATSAMFSVTDGILLHPLPFPQSERLVNVWESAPTREPSTPGGRSRKLLRLARAKPVVLRHRRLPAGHLQSGVPRQRTGTLPGRDLRSRILRDAARVSDARPRLSPTTKINRAGMASSSWASARGSSASARDTGIVGRQVDINGRSRTVIGVMPRGLRIPGAGR